MAVKIRISRIGTKHAPVFRIIAIDSRRKRDGAALEILGTYNPVTGDVIQFHEDRINAWVAQGAIVTDAVKKIQRAYRSASSAQ
jgi:small subunit ribosomal protein S16